MQSYCSNVDAHDVNRHQPKVPNKKPKEPNLIVKILEGVSMNLKQVNNIARGPKVTNMWLDAKPHVTDTG